MKLKTIISLSLGCALTFLATQGFADNLKPQEQGKGDLTHDKGPVITFPRDTVLILTINSKNEAAFYDRRGAKLPDCKLCTPEVVNEYGLESNCKNADKKGITICPGTVDKTIRNFQTIALYETEGSICRGGSIAGFRSGVCYPTPFYCSHIDPTHWLCSWCQNRANMNHPWCK